MKRSLLAALAAAVALSACGGGTYTIEIKQTDGTPVGNGTVTVPATPSAPAPSPAPTPAPAPAAMPVPTDIVLGDWPTTLLQTGPDTAAYWLEDGVWGAGSLTRGAYTGLTGTQYEQKIGVSKTFGTNGEVAGRMTWKWPTGTTEVKSYPSFVVGNKPGWQNSWTVPGGFAVRLLDGTNSQTYPSGKTPGSFFPLQLPIQSLKSSFAYKHNMVPTGRGHLSYDIWLQNKPEQCHGFNNCQELTHEIMIPLDYWGGYGSYPTRNPGWYSHDVTIDGLLWHVYYAPNFNGQWKFIVFEPHAPIKDERTLDLAAFVNYVATKGWATGNEHLVSVELGVEPVDGEGDLTIYNYRVWR